MQCTTELQIAVPYKRQFDTLTAISFPSLEFRISNLPSYVLLLCVYDVGLVLTISTSYCSI